MRALELKIPPPVVALLVGVAMWAISHAAARIEISAPVRIGAALVIAIAGVCIAVAGALAFRHAHTTTSPVKPEAASSLVTSGIYRFTRNPMYLGLCLVLLAWAFFLSSVLAFMGPIVFVFYIGRFKIAPEERALSRIFGAAFADYRATVRRWI